MVVAEIGINHRGSAARAKKMIAAAHRAGADAVKMQYYHTDRFISRHSEAGRTWHHLFKKYELNDDAMKAVKIFCDEQGILFFASPFDEDAVDRLEEMAVSAYKIASGDVINVSLLERVAETGKPVIMSTGAATVAEVAAAVELIRKYHSKLILLHCISEYPTPPEHVNLRVMRTLEELFDVPVGFSDHTAGSRAAACAAGMGAQLIEKHFMLRGNQGMSPDAAVSLAPGAFRAMVKQIREASLLRGNGRKAPTAAEHEMNKTGRRSLYARSDIEQGETVTESMVIALRPAAFISPADIRKITGVRAKRFIHSGEPLSFDILEEM